MGQKRKMKPREKIFDRRKEKGDNNILKISYRSINAAFYQKCL